ncbi:cyclase family protein [Amycolatopsis pigmentata]|uniref:Cyclase family protein n=1 Tax=Amycolatopsis pigmentata TaxID=450801 RepID=A0ABW5FM99_9PSEU
MATSFGLDEISIERLFESLTNWGRWGEHDEKGTLNLISARNVLGAVALVADGTTISLSRTISDEPGPDVLDPPIHHMLNSGEHFALHPESVPDIGLQLSRDFLGWTFHGLYMTHLDALSHVFFKGQMYNGKSSQLVTTHQGATVCSVEVAATGITTRGLLADIPRYRGVRWLENGEPVGPEELEAVLESQGLVPRSGDALIVRTGYWGRREAEGPSAGFDGLPGLHAACLPLLRKWDISLLASDAVNDVLPSGFDVMRMPIHEIGQVSMGLWLQDNCDLEQLSEACLSRKRYEFMFSISPMRIHNGTGSPTNPIAIF